MASNSTNASIEALRARHAAEEDQRRERQRIEEAAVGLVGEAAAAVHVARGRRAQALAELDAQVVSAERGHDVALTVLAQLLGEDETAASIAGVDVAAVRTARRRAPRDEVEAAVGAVRSAPAPRRRAGRPAGRRAAAAEPSERVDTGPSVQTQPVAVAG